MGGEGVLKEVRVPYKSLSWLAQLTALQGSASVCNSRLFGWKKRKADMAVFDISSSEIGPVESTTAAGLPRSEPEAKASTR